MKVYYNLLILIGLTTLLSSCFPDENGSVGTPSSTAMENLKVPSAFNFKTSKEITFKIGAFDNTNSPISGVIMSVYSYPNQELLFKGITTSNGTFSLSQKIPTYVTKIAVRPDFIGLPSETIITLNGTTAEIIFGGNNPTASESIDQPVIKSARIGASNAQTYPAIDYLGSWNSDGLPSNLEKDRDPITSSFLQYVNASLPEGKSVPSAHPDFLNNNNRNFLYITEAADVWVTFVHEGAGWKNTLGYYTFNPLNPPKTTADISKMNIVFPNVSYKGAGGALISGDKVKIGQFPAGTGIGFVLLADAFASSKVGKGNYAHFSHDALNVESKASLRRHLIVLNEPTSKRMILAFEDIERESPTCDQDFNDAIFYATSNPIKAIDTNNVPIVDSPKDTDGDGVGDSRDEYPTDPNRAINNYIPGSNTYSTLAYEDLWPSKGDYDMNDLVINYQFQEVLNAKNEVVDLKAKFYVKAVGASFKNGWGFQLPIDPSMIKSVSGHSLTDGAITNSANGTEAGQKYATIIAFDNAFKQMKTSGGGFVNTIKGTPVVAPNDTLRMTINFTSPINKSSLGSAPYNPFLFSTSNRGKEVHLPNMIPTSKADMSLFGKESDSSVPGSGIYYKTANLLPWAIDLHSDFKYPSETIPIVDAYYEFGIWVESGGVLYPDWYVISKNYFNSAKVF
ncbi:LruC domain-containing protein [Arcicella rosea]|uniref:LruC domain-containing protein n=1 Tax=Arcicella rosea TaxID=502909 RepID=A0A841EDV4_9BACT|nr:LruC domain-containing protein [Arcicella rosea]MBB6001362.1 LruC domain-containing protein [Arcicella rosea]